jgi:thiosulfate dehydrogenase [quinone] large subunit
VHAKGPPATERQGGGVGVTGVTRATLALLPIRFFFGATFLWAGLDKLLDPTFLDPSAPTSLHAQLVEFARFSPLGGLIQASLPFSSAIGLLIAVGELGIGIGALTGLAFRVAAAGGFVLSMLLWLTASWATHPYYFGADLPYAAGWLALAIAGPGGLLVPARFSEVLERAGAASTLAPPTRRERRAAAAAGRQLPHAAYAPASPERRLLLQTATLAGLSAVLASLTLPLRVAGILVERNGASSSPSPVSPGGSGPPSATSDATIPPGSIGVGTVAKVQRAGAATFTVPLSAPASLPAGDPGVIVQLADGSFVAFDTICTHAGCTVEWDRADRLLVCPCHEAVFDPEDGAAVLGGPAPSPLKTLPIVVDVASGQILIVPRA